MYHGRAAVPLPLDRRQTDDRTEAMRYRHLQRIAEREARLARAARDAGELERALWAGLDAGERSRWAALNSLLEDGGR
jgi:hypothetical protein